MKIPLAFITVLYDNYFHQDNNTNHNTKENTMSTQRTATLKLRVVSQDEVHVKAGRRILTKMTFHKEKGWTGYEIYFKTFRKAVNSFKSLFTSLLATENEKESDINIVIENLDDVVAQIDPQQNTEKEVEQQTTQPQIEKPINTVSEQPAKQEKVTQKHYLLNKLRHLKENGMYGDFYLMVCDNAKEQTYPLNKTPEMQSLYDRMCRVLGISESDFNDAGEPLNITLRCLDMCEYDDAIYNYPELINDFEEIMSANGEFKNLITEMIDVLLIS